MPSRASASWSATGTPGRVGLGYVTGFGLMRGAMASTVAHDAHNCMVVGALDDTGPAEMAAAVARLAEIGGGQVAVLDGKVIAEVELPVGGLMSLVPPSRSPQKLVGSAPPCPESWGSRSRSRSCN